MYCIREAARKLGIDLDKATIAVQGYSNAGYYTAKLAREMFVSRIIAVCDSQGGCCCKTGIDPKEANKIKTKTTSVCNLKMGDKISDEDLLELDVDILYKKDIHVIPDFLCNAGGVTVSYFEMVQNFNMYYWDEDEVYDRLDKNMTTAYNSVWDTHKDYKINMRQAAYVRAVERVVEAMKLCGWV